VSATEGLVACTTDQIAGADEAADDDAALVAPSARGGSSRRQAPADSKAIPPRTPGKK
jgi:hypothetical protein